LNAGKTHNRRFRGVFRGGAAKGNLGAKKSRQLGLCALPAKFPNYSLKQIRLLTLASNLPAPSKPRAMQSPKNARSSS